MRELLRAAVGFYIKLEAILLKYLIPAAGFFVLLLETTPLGDLIGFHLTPAQLSGVVVFIVSLYGAKIWSVAATTPRTGITIVGQEEALPTALAHLSSGRETVDILIYTSFSIFSNFEAIVRQYPLLRTAKLRLLVRDPDVPGLVPYGRYSDLRRNQLGVALDALRQQRLAGRAIQIRFYRNEPWVRGICIDSSALLYSTYADKRTVGEDGGEDTEYSGSRTPWFMIDAWSIIPASVETGRAKEFIRGFKSLYELIWEQCTRYKTLVLDLDGTLYSDKALDDLFRRVPMDFVAKLLPDPPSRARVEASFNQLQRGGASATEAILTALHDVGCEATVAQYIAFKDSLLPTYPLDRIRRNEALIQALQRLAPVFRLVIVTNHTRALSSAAIRRLDLQELIRDEDIITLDDMQEPKPGQAALRELGERKIALETAVFIGDRRHVDLSYVEGRCLATIRVEDPSRLAAVLDDLTFPVEWLRTRQHPGVDIR